jgi:N-acetylglucosaminyldiphosphoundecaprenol N-acetyl-beta-D-mannosaminyltransferase
VSGVDLADGICSLAAKRGWSIYLLGAGPGVAEEAAQKLQETHDGLKIAGIRDGYFSEAEEIDVIEAVRDAEPDIVFVAMGIPRQEKLLSAHLGVMGAKVGVGLGGSLDVFSGRVKRAPVIIQKLRVEWLWRLILNPSKIAKVMMLPKFMVHVMREGR